MSAYAAIEAPATIVNGVNVSALMDTVEAVKQNPEIAAFRFRGRNTWLGGAHNRSTVKQFHGAGEEQRRAEEGFVIENGEPEVLLGADEGPNPGEHC